MGEFRLPPRALETRRHDNIMVGLASIGTILLAFATLLLVGYGPHSVVRRAFPILSSGIVLLVLSALVTVLVAMRRSSQRVRHELTFVLNENELIRKRPGHPDVRLPLSQIKSLYNQSGCLVVAGGDPPLRVAVPKEVENFELLKAELMKYASPVSPPRRSSHGWVTSSLFIIFGLLLIWSGNVVTIRAAAGVFVVLLGWESFKLRLLLRNSPKRFLFWLMMGSVWLSTGFLIYLRVFGGRL